MSEQEQQFKYIDDRVLIESSRVTSSDFPDIGVCLTGQELEILRNLMSYATRRTTFVGEYHDSYYKVADNADWVVIENVVADLERKIMGNDNTIWGYHDRYVEEQVELDVAPGTQKLFFSTVPAGEVWRVTGMVWLNADTSGSFVIAKLADGDDVWTVDVEIAPTSNEAHPSSTDIVLKEGDRLELWFYGCASGDDIYGWAHGYKMKVSG